MPRYHYRCKCGWEEIRLNIPVEKRDKIFCPECKASPMIILDCQAQSPSRDNREFNNGQGVHNQAFGEVIRDRGQLRDLEKHYGVERVLKTRDQFEEDLIRKPSRIKFKTERVKELHQQAAAEVSKGWEPSHIEDPELEKKVETLVRKEHPRMADISLMRGREEVPDESL